MMRRTVLLTAVVALALGLTTSAEANVGLKAKGLTRQSASPVYYRNRSFDPATGRFLQRDPVLGGDPLYSPKAGRAHVLNNE